jgi:hypothetical protein
LYDVEMVQAKLGKTAAYEKAWKAHVVKYHNGDNKRYAEEILSGANSGNLLLISGPYSLADLDKERANSAAHAADWDLTVSPSVEKVVTSGTYRYADSLSYNPNTNADKFSTTIYHVIPGKQQELYDEIKRSIAVYKKINSAASIHTYIKLWAGSDPEVVISTQLKDGFKQLDNSFNPTMAKDFQTAYTKEYGKEAWDKRVNLIPMICATWETYISKTRKDLSSAMK